MACYLLTWNPKRSPYYSAKARTQIGELGFYKGRWSCGRSQRIEAGDQVYLLRQASKPTGLIGSGTVVRGSYRDKHWNKDAKQETAIYVDVRWDFLGDPSQNSLLETSEIDRDLVHSINWSTQSSGITIAPEVAAQLAVLWRRFLKRNGHASSQPNADKPNSREGRRLTVQVNSYERNPRARDACIEIYGWSCCVCGFDFESFYGKIGNGFIHVHHLNPLAGSEGPRDVDPEKDLRPVCPNCHAMIHQGGSVRDIKDLKRRISKQKG